MAEKDLRRLAIDLLRDFRKSVEEGEKSARKALERQQGQILVINKKRFLNIIQVTINSLSGDSESNKTILESIWKDFTNWLDTTKPSSVKDADRLESLKQAAEESNLYSKGKVIFISTYDGYRKPANKRIKEIVVENLKKARRKVNNRDIQRLGGTGASRQNVWGAQLGHADEEVGGMASSGLRVIRAEQMLSKAAIDTTRLTNLVKEYKDNIKLDISHEQVVDANTGLLKKEYIPILTYQEAWINQALNKEVETPLLNAFERGIVDIINDKSSPSLLEATEQTLLYNLAGKPLPGKKITGTKKKTVKSKTKSKAKQKIKTQRKVKLIKDGGGFNTGVLKALSVKNKGKAKTSSNNTLFGLMALLNQKLPNTVRKNMGPPGLTNITGTFANSVKVTDIGRTARGYPSIGYTYLKSPYEVFEVGSGQVPWATPERDPRRLIDKSIREIAANMAIGRFYTRRQ